jgi:hypothetical protein
LPTDKKKREKKKKNVVESLQHIDTEERGIQTFEGQ